MKSVSQGSNLANPLRKGAAESFQVKRAMNSRAQQPRIGRPDKGLTNCLHEQWPGPSLGHKKSKHSPFRLNGNYQPAAPFFFVAILGSITKPVAVTRDGQALPDVGDPAGLCD